MRNPLSRDRRRRLFSGGIGSCESDGVKDLLAVIQLVKKLLVEALSLVACRRSQSASHDVAQAPVCEIVVLVNVRDHESFRGKDNLGVIEKVELDAPSVWRCKTRKGNAHLQGLVAQLEHNDMLHANILLHKLHPVVERSISVRVVVVSVETVHDVLLKVLQQVYFALEVFWVVVHRVVLSNIDGLTFPRHERIDAPETKRSPSNSPAQLTKTRTSCWGT